ncbi:MAG: SIMPL domain-containing protein, partial [Propionicimonas sp.]|nr:SIMPL domain-containing protein [Propionicimonas sp.]
MGTLRISIDDSVRVTADSARLHVRVKGTSAVFGNAATKQAREVRDLVEALAGTGLSEDAIEVTGVSLTSRSGALGKNQSAEYLLAITTAPEQLGSVIGVLADRPSLVLSELEWVYSSFEASIPATAQAMAKARRKADAVAAAAGLRVIGIAAISDSWNLPSPRFSFEAADGMMMSARSAKAAPVELGV